MFLADEIFRIKCSFCDDGLPLQIFEYSPFSSHGIKRWSWSGNEKLDEKIFRFSPLRQLWIIFLPFSFLKTNGIFAITPIVMSETSKNLRAYFIVESVASSSHHALEKIISPRNKNLTYIAQLIMLKCLPFLVCSVEWLAICHSEIKTIQCKSILFAFSLLSYQ